MTASAAVATLLLVIGSAAAASSTSWAPPSSQLAPTPPRGWRSWIAYQHHADQAKMEGAIAALHKKRPLGAGGAPVSLQDLGYADVGLDGGWATCAGVNASYHDAQGKLLVNYTKFPSFAAMNAKAHTAGITSSWYLNCDQCVTTENLTISATTDAWYASDAKLAAELQFDGVKFDTQPNGPNWNISRWSEALAATKRPMVIEDCLDKHPDGTALKPQKGDMHPKIDILHDPANCPVSFYRTGGDNSPDFLAGMSHTLVDLEPFLRATVGGVPASRPGCWAYIRIPRL